MKPTLKKLFFICLVMAVILSSCKNTPKFSYSQDESISSNVGVPKKAFINYFPIIESDAGTAVSYDTFHIKLYSKVLFKIGEPILYNFYISKPVIRLTWMRPSGKPMVLSVEEIDGKIQLKENGYETLTPEDKSKHPKDTVKRIYRAKALNYEQKQKLITLLNKNKFFEMPDKIAENTTTGTQLAVEYHDASNYHLVYRSVTDGTEPNAFREICNYIIELSNFKTDKRY